MHIDALRRLGVEIIGVLGSSAASTAEKARSFGVPRAYESYDELVSDPDVDVVHLATPNRHHYPQALAAVEAGKHVVCEKPLALTSADSAQLARRAEAAGVVNAVCFNSRFYPLCLQAREMVAMGTIGTPRLVTGSYLQDWLLLSTDWNWRLVPEDAGALQAVGDIGSHWLDLVRFVTGRGVETVMADLHTLVPVRRRPAGPVETFAQASRAIGHDSAEVAVGGDDAAGVLLRFEGGARGVMTVSQVSPGLRNALSFRVDGAEAALSWSSERSEELWVGRRDHPNQVLPRDPALLAPAASRRAVHPGGHVEGFPDTFRALFAAVYEDVGNGAPSSGSEYARFADGHEGLLVGEAIARSAALERWTMVGGGG